MIPTPKTDTWIDINTFDVPEAEYRQLGFLHRIGEYKNEDRTLAMGNHRHFTFTKYVASTAIGIDVPSNQDMVKLCYTFYPVDE